MDQARRWQGNGDGAATDPAERYRGTIWDRDGDPRRTGARRTDRDPAVARPRSWAAQGCSVSGEGPFAFGYTVGMRSKRTTQKQRRAALLRLAKLLANAGRTVATKADRQVVAREHGTTAKTLSSWQSRYSEDWKAALVAAGLQTMEPFADEDTSCQVVRNKEKQRETISALTARQAQACRWIIADGKQHVWVAKKLGVHRYTISDWTRLGAWAEYAQALRRELHDAIIGQHIAVAAAGGRLRVRYIEEVGRIFDLVEADTNGEVMTVDALAKLAPAIDRITTSAEDRAGHPKTDRIEHQVDHGESGMAGAGASGGGDERARLRAALDAAGSGDS